MHELWTNTYHQRTNTEDSDIDLAFVIDDKSDIIDAQIDLMKLRRKIDLRIEPHPFNRMDFMQTNPLVAEILKDGIQIGP